MSFLKDPSAVLDFPVDWSKWLLRVEDIIDSSTWTEPDGITVDSDTFTDLETVVWLSGGTLGQEYKLTNTVTTRDGRTDERTITVSIVNR